ncbi:SUMF1/EgtB/PvdO family nonheme iron enzyme [Kamptonema sp. UHCC 0994]|uniref:SUMF1/EgtB/PvdO family nonheme iron enzyme n=1 Tax=Kamptonema sp. UHCC 0994 TaxID=3031329 RepID=UPI0023B95F5D|nr:SUMF1/EgtB/PvdO family nonheme iron enzyme [Kamptonema sp. UHCC 0994]MDF0552006.1 SUMF1/EgtB/PvdO family nonheme iron enzyme [Kamptonema sp. UHCC 0994]
MISTSVEFRREAIALALHRCRIGTLKLFDGIDWDTFCRQAHPEFSPAGWHLGHIAYTEEMWLLQRCAGISPVFPKYRQLFAADSLPKKERVYLPTFAEVCCYLETVRKNVLDYLIKAPIEEQERLWQFIIQHESQHCEIIAFILQMQRKEKTIGEKEAGINILPTANNLHSSDSSMIEISRGKFEMGNDGIDALDNERSRHPHYLETYCIDTYPVTCNQYRKFIDIGGYQNPQYWSKAGWKWLQNNPVNQPLYWSNNPIFDNHPVSGVSWYEAEAYCQFIGKRLPTEAEWEKAASWSSETHTKNIYPWGEEELKIYHCNHDNSVGKTTPVDTYPEGKNAYGCWDMLGNVWEWTASWFHAYEGFESYPYQGYSQTYFDGEHRVLKGGSWATRPWALRSSFRNWYHPGVRQIIAGFRCAK